MPSATASLPSDPQALRVLAASLQEALAAKERELAARDAEIHAKTLQKPGRGGADLIYCDAGRAVVNFEVFRPELERAVPRADRSKGGRPPFDDVRMFKVLILQTQNNLSDERTEFYLRDRLAEQAKRGGGRPRPPYRKAGDAELLARIRPLVDARPSGRATATGGSPRSRTVRPEAEGADPRQSYKGTSNNAAFGYEAWCVA
jgi:Transposase domain (DUF772)